MRTPLKSGTRKTRFALIGLIPSWAVIGTADHAIPPAAQEFMARRAHATVTKINALHLSLISQPGEVTNVIEEAARHTS